MELNIRPPDQLIIDETSTSMRHVWENWIENLENFFLATDITDIKRKKALLLQYNYCKYVVLSIF